MKFPKPKGFADVFFRGTRERQVLQGGNLAMAAGGETVLNRDKTRPQDGHRLLEELCWPMLVSGASRYSQSKYLQLAVYGFLS